MGKPPNNNNKSSQVPTMDDFNALANRVTALESRMDVVEVDVLALQGDVGSLDDRVTTLEEEAGTVDPEPPDPNPEPPDPGPEPEPGSRTPLVIRVMHNDSPLEYKEADGREFQVYKDPKGEFQQRCIQITNPVLPNFVVHSRPDVAGDREEVVLENTSVAHGANPGIMYDYTVTIMQGDVVLHEEVVPMHYGYSRWHWVSWDRPIREEIPDLIERGLLLNWSESLAKQSPPSQVHSYEIMGLAGISGAMQGTGERPDIGPVTEYQADYICTGRNLSTVMAQGEACGTLPWHWRDLETGAWADVFTKFPHASQYGNDAANPLWPTDWKLSPDNGDRVATIQLDSAHMPAVVYLPWILTGDPYYLEELQAQVQFDIISQPGDGREFNIWFAIRAHAWALRSVAQAALTTPEDAPDWLLPRSYYKNYLDSNRDWLLNEYVNNLVPQYQLFSTTEKAFGDNDESPQAPQGTYSQTYMEEFELTIFAWLVRMGFEDWKPIVEWKAKNTIGRTNGTSGWVRAVSTPYRQLLKTAKADPFFTNWKDSWDLTQQRYNLTYTDPNKLAITGNDISYPTYTEGALAAAKGAGVADASAPHDWAHAEVNRLIDESSARSRARKWCILP